MSPFDYSCCDKTVTVYRLAHGQVRRLVVPGCYYFWEEQEMEDELGCRRETKFVLIMPGPQQRVGVGDRVYDGVGPEVGPEQWNTFLPVNVPGLGQVAYVRPAWWDGKIIHVEAGRK